MLRPRVLMPNGLRFFKNTTRTPVLNLHELPNV